jgi:hypothetical protein
MDEVRGCIQKFPEWVDNEIYAYKNKHSLGSNTKDCGGKTYYTYLQNSDITAPNGSSRSRRPVVRIRLRFCETEDDVMATASIRASLPCHGSEPSCKVVPSLPFGFYTFFYYAELSFEAYF